MIPGSQPTLLELRKLILLSDSRENLICNRMNRLNKKDRQYAHMEVVVNFFIFF